MAKAKNRLGNFMFVCDRARQYFLYRNNGIWLPYVLIERFVPGSPRLRSKDRSNRRRKWCIVDYSLLPKGAYHTKKKPLFAPVLFGPFDDIRLAMFVFESACVPPTKE